VRAFPRRRQQAGFVNSAGWPTTSRLPAAGCRSRQGVPGDGAAWSCGHWQGQSPGSVVPSGAPAGYRPVVSGKPETGPVRKAGTGCGFRTGGVFRRPASLRFMG